ncbi:hypothetical protein HD806DRAFT_551311 [Xylariaceae sp. AK1471]|nr:hypothetical protein HD806DRAFT_551311 [Xylariaceae sp. AK1471]
MEDLDRAIKYFQHALDLTPTTHPNRALHLRDLAFAYEDKYLETGSNAARSHALENFERAFKHDFSSIQDYLKVGIAVVVRYTEGSDWKQAYDVASKTVPLVKLMTPRFLENSDKNKLLARALNFAPIAAAVALKANKPPYEAVRLVETGRGIIVGSLNEIRSDISELQERYPRQAEKFLHLRDKLDTPTTSISAEIRYKSGQKLEQVVQEIRGLSGFERFLELPSETDLKTAAKHGTITIINVSDYGCDALIIEETQIQALQLPDLCISDIRNYAKVNLAKLEVLRWLWRTVALPVLDTLRFQPSPDYPWPHLWWIPTGPLSGFPIHAAG